MSQLLTILTTNFSREELKTLAFDLSVDFDEFADKGKTSQARDLVQFLQRRQRLSDLVALGRQLRPKVEWPTPDALLEGKRIVPVSPQLQPYLEMVMRRYGRLPLSPLDPSGRESARVSLAQIFINLDAAQTEYARYQDNESRKIVSEWYSAALAHIHENPQLILLGDPGSGKSTLLRYLAYYLALAALEPDEAWLTHLKWNHILAKDGQKLERESLSSELLERSDKEKQAIEKHWAADAPLPVFVELRDFAQTAFDPASPRALWHYVCRQLENEELAETIPALKALAQQGEVIFLLDGVDEVPTRQRPQVWQAIAALADGAYGGCRWVTTCRILSFAREEAPPRVADQTLQPLNKAQIEQFVASWYAALTAELGSDKAANMTGQLQQAAQRPRIQALAQNPMLLTIMAIVQTYYGTLPEERARLYQACVETLLLRWQRFKDIPDVLELLGSNQRQLERLLWEVAWEAHNQAPDGDAAADMAEMELIQIARRHLGGDLKKAVEFVEYTERRAHLLVGRGGLEERRYTFPHRTFQEYLAACFLASGRRFPQQAAQLAAQGDTWREVLNLAAGTLVFNQQDNWQKVLDGVAEVTPTQTPDADDESGWFRVWLAGEMAVTAWREEAETDEVGREVLPRLRQQLAALLETGRLLPTQRAEAGVALGWLGDPRPDVACEIPAMVEILAGPFLMGSDKKVDKEAYDREEPQHKLELPAYAIGKYPVTVAQYRRFVEADGYNKRDYWTAAGWQYRQDENWTEPRYWQDPRWTVPNCPVVGVSWYEAVVYCNWLKTTTGRDFRLPDEAMWEKAARGTDGRIYPWGDDWNPTNLNAGETGIGQTSAVGMFPNGRSPFGIYDASGNVWEWCSGLSPSNAPYPFQQKTYEEDMVASGNRSWRGGAFFSHSRLTRAAYRDDYLPLFRYNYIGFRVAEHLS